MHTVTTVTLHTVNRHTGGLEIHRVRQPCVRQVNRHTGGLEN